MQKRRKGRKLSRKRNQRKALLKALASALILNEKMKTSQAKAKETAGFVESFITIAKKGDLSSRRKLSEFFSPKIVKKLIADLAPRYQGRSGGYTRIIKLGRRKSDGAKMAIIELIK